MTQSVALRSGQIGPAMPVGMGSFVKFEISNGSGYVEYTFDTEPMINAGSAAWTIWPVGAVSSTQQDVAAFNMFVRGVCLSGQAIVSAFDPDFTQFPANQAVPWKSRAVTNVATNGGANLAGATANMTALTAALRGGGVVSVMQPGPFYMTAAGVSIPSYTRLVFGDATIPTILPGMASRGTLFKNANYNSTQYAVAASALTCAAGRIGTVRFTTATDFAVGDYLCLLYAVPDEYNGVWRVLTISSTTFKNDTLTFRLTSSQVALTPALTSPATVLANVPGGAILGMKADVAISIEGGVWNYGGYDQGSYPITVDQRDIMINLRRIKHGAMRNMIIRGAHYGSFLQNCYDFAFEDVNAEDSGVATIFSGSGRGIHINRVAGNVYDNLVAIQQGDYAGYLDAGYAMGDFSGVVIENLQCDGPYVAGKCVAASANIPVKFRDTTICGINGWTTGSSVWAFVDDVGMVPYFGASAAPTTRMGTVTIQNWNFSKAQRMNAIYVQDGAGITASVIDHLRISDVNVVLSSDVGQATSLMFLNKVNMAVAQIGRLDIRGCSCIADAPTNNTTLFEDRGGVTTFNLEDCYAENLMRICNQTANAQVPILDGNISNISTKNSGAFWRNGRAGNEMRFRNWKAQSAVEAAVTAVGGSLTCSMSQMGQGIAPTNFWNDAAWSSAAPYWEDDYRYTQSTSAATHAINYALGNYAEITLTQATQQFLNPSRPPSRAGAYLRLSLVQDGTGGRLVTWDTQYKNMAALGAGAAGQRAMVELIWNGVNWMYSGGSVFA